MTIEVHSVRLFETSEFEIGTTRICSHARNSNDKMLKILMEGPLIGPYVPTKSHAILLSGCCVLRMCTFLSLKLPKHRTPLAVGTAYINIFVSLHKYLCQHGLSSFNI